MMATDSNVKTLMNALKKPTLATKIPSVLILTATSTVLVTTDTKEKATQPLTNPVALILTNVFLK
jgi:hypothetical protein